MKKINLCYFDGDVNASALSDNSAEAAPAANTEVGTQAQPQAVQYGKQPGEEKTPAGKRSEHEQLTYKQLKEQFKDEYQADLQRVIDKRFKNAKRVEAQRNELLEKQEKLAPLITALSEHYGTEDVEQLVHKISQDEGFLLREAQAENMNPEDYKKLHSARRQAESYKQELESVKAAVRQQEIVEQWQQEAEALSALYPDFKLEDEVDNERFSTALQSGMSMRDAYQYAHFDEILSGVIEYTAQNVKNSISQGRLERSERPMENGIHSGAPAIVKNDVSKLSKEDMEEIDRRVLRGERISF